MNKLFNALFGQIKGTCKADAPCTLRASVNTEELYLEIYGPIGESIFSDGITAQQVADALKSPHSGITVRLNSPGGSMFEGLAIYNLLKTAEKPVHVIVDGLAASAASLIAMAGDTVEMNTGTMIMIHPAQAFAMGDSVKMREMSELLEKASGSMADVYAARSKQTREKVLEMMYAETWLSAEEAIDLGFADKMSKDAGKPEAVAAAFNLSIYAKTPESLKVFDQPQDPQPEPKGTPVADLARRALELY